MHHRDIDNTMGHELIRDTLLSLLHGEGGLQYVKARVWGGGGVGWEHENTSEILTILQIASGDFWDHNNNIIHVI
jgi:hypothetical protein